MTNYGQIEVMSKAINKTGLQSLYEYAGRPIALPSTLEESTSKVN